MKKRYKTYVTYRFDDFDARKIKIDLESVIGKPRKAFWGSPINAEYGWKEWCIDNDFIDDTKTYFSNPIKWTFKGHTRILTIKDMKDVNKLERSKYIILFDDDGFKKFKWNFEKVLEDYDAIELEDGSIGHRFQSRLETDLFNSWDCDCIVVLNPDKIQLL